MEQIIFQKKSVIALVLVIILSAAWLGCSTTVKERQQGQPATGATGEAKTEGEGTGKYYLDDVRVPSELNYKPNKSFVYETPRFKTGILHFSKWRLDVSSLIDFFTYNMEKDNWKLVNSFRGKESFLNFSKPDKTCSIKMVEKWYGATEVEIRVGPLGEKKM
ncbi:MAG: hypothetical protein COZ69_04825 [Deltaproteobacteria bacterium CG_4_8_14_3_um_filter_45_9]|nr:MAG: hypothetical protein COS40_06255 [Deltaproteobacteria bacterium CG03_land_8_20_14_0_80_45_14]PIX24910.1 MAG: hypothetical protein COZ69_04825 [Deltaproteobacteria bacterium CG_4_8_14_3_um_filter_45_9]